jgi:hypothetical protein
VWIGEKGSSEAWDADEESSRYFLSLIYQYIGLLMGWCLLIVGLVSITGSSICVSLSTGSHSIGTSVH